MPITALNREFSNRAAFIDSLFDDDDVRSVDKLKPVVASGKLHASFAPSETGKVLQLWQRAWEGSQAERDGTKNAVNCPPEDVALIAFLRHYIATNNLYLFVPQLKMVGMSAADTPIYELSHYAKHDFSQHETVRYFLELLLFGAHFVAVHAPLDLPAGVVVSSLWQDFKASRLKRMEKHDPGNSHYAELLNICGQYYLHIDQNQAPDNSPFLLALLIDATVAELDCEPARHNSFMQLEGWQAHLGLDNRRHMADFETHKVTLWNISTFGACAYSEKRGTAVFLAPEAWNPQPNNNTIMPPYVGAESLQKWLEQGNVRLPEGEWRVVTRARCQPLDGERHRASSNFALAPPAGVKQLKWHVKQNVHREQLSFAVWLDKRAQLDEAVFKQVWDGMITAVPPHGSRYYIANPQGGTAGDDFVVEIEPVREP